jgi:hypothetical protein
VLDDGFRVLEDDFRILCNGFRVLDNSFRVLGDAFRMLDDPVGYLVSFINNRLLGYGNRLRLRETPTTWPQWSS